MPKYRMSQTITSYMELVVEAKDPREAFTKAREAKSEEWEEVDSDNDDMDIELFNDQ